jgi:hypothetical protein
MGAFITALGPISPTFLDQSRAAFAQIIIDAFKSNNSWQKCNKT